MLDRLATVSPTGSPIGLSGGQRSLPERSESAWRNGAHAVVGASRFGSPRVVHDLSHDPAVDDIPCAANHLAPCLRRDDHLPTCPGDCTGCTPRPAVRGYLCRRHYEQVERPWNAHARLAALADVLGIDARAIQPTWSASTIAGPRVPLSALQLDLDALARMDAGDVQTEESAGAAPLWGKAVFAAAARHPDQPRKERPHRLRCPTCRRQTAVVHPPEYAGGTQLIACQAEDYSWFFTDPDFTEAVAHMELRVDARTRRLVSAQAGHTVQGEDRAGLARLVDAIRA